MGDDIDLDTRVKLFVKNQSKLIDAEFEEEKKEFNYDTGKPEIGLLESKGVLINDVMVDNVRSEFGACVVEFSRTLSKKETGAVGISSGDIASIWYHDEEAENKKTFLASGTVMQVANIIKMSFDSSSPFNWDQERKYFILKSMSEVTFKRMKNALESILKHKYGRSDMIMKHLFGNAKLEKQDIHPCLLNENKELKYFNSRLHPVQKEAVKFCLEQKNFAIVHGPPGTGKTTVLVEIILQLVNTRNKILVCAPSNIAVDNVVEKLGAIKSKIIRVGKTARMLESSKNSSLGAAMSLSDNAPILKAVKDELEEHKSKLKTSSEGAKKYLYQKIKDLRKEFNFRQYRMLQELLKNASVVLTTLTSASDDGDLKNVPSDHFDVVIIDECSQAIEAACWIVIPKAPKLIIAGDHLQLPPTVKSKVANEGGLGMSLMERAIAKIGEDCYKLLVHQFRMNSLIMQWVSSFYQNKLVADESVAKRLLIDLPGVKKTEETETPLLLVDTGGLDAPEKECRGSKCNEFEANIVALLVKRLIDAGVNENEISVITPYSLQVSCIKSKINNYPEVEVRSVDGFQGREKAAIIISLVRSNKDNELGFLTDKRRLNVAVSRAQCFLAVVGNSCTVSKDDTIHSLWKHIEEHGVYYSAHELSEDIDELNLPIFTPHSKEDSKSQKAKSKAKKGKQAQISINKTEILPIVKKENPSAGDLEKTFKSHQTKDIIQKVVEKGKKDVQKPDTRAKNYMLVGVEDCLSDDDQNSATEVESCDVKEEIKIEPKVKTKIQKKGSDKKIQKKDDVKTREICHEGDDDDIKAIKESKVRNLTCSKKGCGVNIKLYPQLCRHCNETYCLAHILPEAHGCGEAAKRAARNNLPNPQPSKSEKAKRDQQIMSTKLKNKVAQMAEERKRKSKK